MLNLRYKSSYHCAKNLLGIDFVNPYMYVQPTKNQFIYMQIRKSQENNMENLLGNNVVNLVHITMQILRKEYIKKQRRKSTEEYRSKSMLNQR